MANLQSQIENTPQEPGVYQFYDKDSKLLYVGKAKNLKKRVKSYFQVFEDSKNRSSSQFLQDSSKAKNASIVQIIPNPKNSPRIRKMVSEIDSIHSIIVENEQEALILENSFIKSQNPKYNILLRDDKTYPYISINLDEKYPRFEITRIVKTAKNMLYFGPYPRGAKEILNSLYEMFPLVQQKSCLKGKKVCLYYQIDKCLGVCEYKDSQKSQKYDNYVKNALDLMQNKSKMRNVLESKMRECADAELFEGAITHKNCLAILQDIQHFSVIDLKSEYSADVLSFLYSGKQGVLLKLFVRNGKVASSHHVFVKANEDCESFDKTQEFECEIYTQALLKIIRDDEYLGGNNLKGKLKDKNLKSRLKSKELLHENLEIKNLWGVGFNRNCKKEIILANISESNFEILQDSIPSYFAKKIIMPKRGSKLKLAKLANNNAKNLLENNQNMHQSENEILEEIRKLFSLKQNLNSIEVFDTSHHSGSFCVGAMISYENNSFCKEKYRHYNLQGKDEYAQIKEMLTRRVRSFDTHSPPNLWLLDGGMAQINLAREILKSINANVEILAIAKEKRDAKTYRLETKKRGSARMSANRAKGRAKDTLRSKDLELRLSESNMCLQFLQKLRDEAHRFAISFHRFQKVRGISQRISKDSKDI